MSTSRIMRAFAGAAFAYACPAFATTTPQSLPFTQNWTNTAQITAVDDWSGVAGIVGFRGDDLTAATGTDARTLLADDVPGVVDVIPGVTAPDTNVSGGVAELEVANPAVALQGSGTADAPYLLLHLDTSSRTNIQVAYNVRDMDGSTDNALQQVALQYRACPTIATCPTTFANVAGTNTYIADATTASTATQVTAVSATLPADADNKPLVQLRIITTNAVGNDEWVGIDDISVTSGVPGLAVSDVSLLEGNSGTTIAQFTVSLPAPAPPGGVTFNIATQDDSATDANNDYEPRSLNGQSIGPGLTSYTFDVTVNGDTVPEANERFFVNVSNVVGSTVSDPQGAGTITNEDIPVRTIAEIQGDAFQSASNGQPTITQNNVVTGVLGNGFFIQMRVPDGLADTSDAMFVFTGTAPTVVVGDVVDVQGTVTEASVVVTSGPNYQNLTKFSNTGLIVSTTATGASLPNPVNLNGATIPSSDPGALYCVVSGGTFTASDFVSTRNFECLEGMRVGALTATVTAPNQSFFDDPIAEVNIRVGGFRAYREPGVSSEVAGETPPAITPAAPPLAPAPGGRIWDGNPEVFEMDVDRFGLTNQILVPGTGVTVNGILGFEFGGYELLAQQLQVIASGPVLPQPVPVAGADQITIASANILHLFNDVNDPPPDLEDDCTPGSADVCPTTQQFQDKLLKVSQHIRTTMRTPMVVALQEVENTNTLNSLVARLNADLAGTSSYVGLIGADQDNDFGHINLAFLVRNDVTVTGQVTQFRTTDTWVFNGTAPDILFDRPPLLLQASTSIGGSPVAFAVLANHTKSLIGVDVIAPNASLVASHRNRQKRLRQAVLTAEIAQNFQVANPTVPLVLVGDFNAFEFSDGYVDVSGIIRGDADPSENQYDPGFDGTLTGAGANGNITVPVLLEAAYALPPAQRYSYSFRGNAQVLDHAFLSSAAVARFEGFAYARDNTDAAGVFATDVGANAVLRSSDHDALVVYLNGGSDATNSPTLLLFSNGFE